MLIKKLNVNNANKINLKVKKTCPSICSPLKYLRKVSLARQETLKHNEPFISDALFQGTAPVHRSYRQRLSEYYARFSPGRVADFELYVP